MFDVGFQELTLIGLIALIVVGPERLPRMARTLGLWMGKIRYYVGQVKSDIDREVRAQELKELLDKPARELDDLKSVAEETKSTLDQARDVLGEAKTALDDAPAGISTPDEPAAGSIFPTELPDIGPARPESPQTASAPSTEAAPAPSESPQTASAPSTEAAPARSESPQTASAPSTEAAPAPSESPQTASAPSTEAAPAPSESPETASGPSMEAAPMTAGSEPTVRPESDVAESGPPDSPSVATETRESDERSSERV